MDQRVIQSHDLLSPANRDLRPAFRARSVPESLAAREKARLAMAGKQAAMGTCPKLSAGVNLDVL